MALEPLYSIDVAAELIPVRKNTLEVFLHRHKEQFPTLLHTGSVGMPIRMLTESECLKIREMMIRLAPKGVKVRRDFSLRKAGHQVRAGYDLLMADL